MTVGAAWLPRGVDPEQPSVARMYDYMLGGGHNFAVDRQLAEQVAAVFPGAREIVLMNRAFLRRAVLFMMSAGIRQFLDVGSGIPTVGNVHELAQRADPEARVLYVDIDPIAIEHAKWLLRGNGRVAAIQADLTDPDGILGHSQARQLLDFTQPMGLLLVGVLHFVSDEWDLNAVVARYRDALATGSYVAMTQLTSDVRPKALNRAIDLAKDHQTVAAYPRSFDRFVTFFDGFELVEPGVVSQPLWRPDAEIEFADGPHRDQILVGVARTTR